MSATVHLFNQTDFSHNKPPFMDVIETKKKTFQLRIYGKNNKKAPTKDKLPHISYVI